MTKYVKVINGLKSNANCIIIIEGANENERN